MKKVSPEEILDLVAYEKARPEYLKRLIALKVPRRVFLGEQLTFVFENRDTVMFQVQEMTRAERTVDERAIAHEVSVYNELIPEPHGLSATLMIEITDGSEIRKELDRLVGIDEHVSLRIGDEIVRASFDEKQFEEDRIAAVQFVRFSLGPNLAQRFADPSVEAALVVDHPNYQCEQVLEDATRASLAADLA